MPFVSSKQQRWGHTAAGEKALGGPAKVAEWDHATRFAQGGPVMNKGYLGKTESFAKGGEVLGRARSFLKIPDQFTDGRLPPKDTGGADDPKQDYGSKSKPKGKDKSLKAVTPRK